MGHVGYHLDPRLLPRDGLRASGNAVPRRATATTPVILALLWLVGCAPLVRPATFVGARDQVTDASLLGPFDGQVLDATTSEPIADAVVVGVWAYDRGDGFIGPHGSETYSTTTDQAGRYRIAPPRLNVRASALRLVSFHVVVYKRGYLGYRSDALYEGGSRPDFVVRHNRVELRKWRETDSHADHLLFLAAPKALRRTTLWEQDLANLDLFRQLGGAGGQAAATQAPGINTPGPVRDPEWLDASGLLTIDEVRTRTFYADPFDVEDLSDLERTDFYHGVHLRARGRDEPWDLAYRVWRAPPGGMDPVVSTIQETMGGVKPSAEITPETWLLTAEGVQAVAFVDREAQVGVLLSCGDQQCTDIETAIILAKTLQRNLDRLRTIPAPKPAAAKPGEALAPMSTTGGPPAGSTPRNGPAGNGGSRNGGTPAGNAGPGAGSVPPGTGSGSPGSSPGTGSGSAGSSPGTGSGSPGSVPSGTGSGPPAGSVPPRKGGRP